MSEVNSIIAHNNREAIFMLCGRYNTADFKSFSSAATAVLFTSVRSRISCIHEYEWPVKESCLFIYAARNTSVTRVTAVLRHTRRMSRSPCALYAIHQSLWSVGNSPTLLWVPISTAIACQILPRIEER